VKMAKRTTLINTAEEALRQLVELRLKAKGK
jgi:hypothetical protein